MLRGLDFSILTRFVLLFVLFRPRFGQKSVAVSSSPSKKPSAGKQKLRKSPSGSSGHSSPSVSTHSPVATSIHASASPKPQPSKKIVTQKSDNHSVRKTKQSSFIDNKVKIFSKYLLNMLMRTGLSKI